ncbi:unnamed protein product [Owenia fusiformis]|uniref:Uncharacterized protein n=1 Tax=Owenia fusiformis TaxID=6347 RepID=A0A8J1Y5Q3_OWEFU|nr:unnamed protein product [Owenia fusiformis]
MATAQEIKDEYLECKICFEPFVTPKVLDCLHSFCLKCLQRIEAKAKNKHIISCPICRCETTTQKGVDGLRVNFLINSLQEAMGKMRAGPVTCEFCDDDASHKCIQCLDDMCKSHASMHTYSKFTRNHNVVPLDEVKSGKYATQIKAAQQVECETHAGKYIELFCTQCDTPVCMMCKITEHDSHKCVTIAQAAATKKAGKLLPLADAI